VLISGSDAGYTMFRGSVKEYWIPNPFASFPVTSSPVRHRVPSHFNWTVQGVMVYKMLISSHMNVLKYFSSSFNKEIFVLWIFNQLDALFSLFSILFFHLYTFQATSAHHQEGTIVSIHPLV
jgi:hypothetical protein